MQEFQNGKIACIFGEGRELFASLGFASLERALYFKIQCPLQLLPLQLLPATAIVAQVFADLKMTTIAVGTEIQKK